MQANGFQDLLTLIASTFRTIFNRLDNFYLVGTFSIIDALIAFIIIDIVITALFVTFNVKVGGGEERVEAHYETPQERENRLYSERESKRLRYW